MEPLNISSINPEDATWAKDLRISCHFWIQRVLLPIFVIVGVIGNLVNVVVLTRKRMSCSTNTYLTALAVSDIMLLIFYLILSFENYPSIKHIDYLPYWKYWRFGVWFADATCGISIWLTVSFTLERYIAVCHPIRGRVLCTESRARRVIVLVYIVWPLITITTPFEWRVEVSKTSSGTRVNMVETSLGTNDTYKKFFYWLWCILIVFVPLIILAILNSFLINAVHNSKRHRNDLTQSQPRNIFREQQENKMTMTLIAVVFMFILCQTPTAVTLIVRIFYKPHSNTVGGHLLGVFGTICNFLVAFNAASNFVLYCFMSDKYRRTLVFTFFPSLAYRHYRADTTSSNASFRLSSIRHASPYS